MRRPARSLVLLACLFLTGCVVLNLLALPFKLLFKVVESIAGGISNLTESIAFLEVHEGPAPRLVPLGDGRFTVEGLTEGARFDVVVTAPGHETRRYRWPADLAGLAAPGDREVAVTCVLRRVPEAE